MSSIRLDSTPREKSQPALAPAMAPPSAKVSISAAARRRSNTAGASSLPLKWWTGSAWFEAARSNGASVAGAAPAGSGARAVFSVRGAPNRGDSAAHPTDTSPASASTTSHAACQTRSVSGVGTAAASRIVIPSPMETQSLLCSSIARVNPLDAAASVHEAIVCRPPASRVGYARQVIEKPLVPRQRRMSSIRAYEPCGARFSPGTAHATGVLATGSVTMPGPDGLPSAQTTRTSDASTVAPVALAT